MHDRIAHVLSHAAMHGLHWLVHKMQGHSGHTSSIKHCASCGTGLPSDHQHTKCCKVPFCRTHVQNYKEALIDSEMKCPLCGYDHS
jgi:hypothetical protein